MCGLALCSGINCGKVLMQGIARHCIVLGMAVTTYNIQDLNIVDLDIKDLNIVALDIKDPNIMQGLAIPRHIRP
jgi:hypothetical protein